MRCGAHKPQIQLQNPFPVNRLIWRHKADSEHDMGEATNISNSLIILVYTGHTKEKEKEKTNVL